MASLIFFLPLEQRIIISSVLVANPNYSIHHGVTREVESGITFDRNAILGNSQWNR